MNRTEIACVITMCAAMLAGLAMFIVERNAHLESKAMAQQHRDACAEQGLPATACCWVGRAWVCPLAMKESNDE
jgi:hypothetical protein